MTTTINEKTYEYRGLSTDVKPMEKAGNGSVFIEMDTGKVYIFDEENLIWIELSKKSGDSDTGSGESGGGANITSNIKIVANKNDILSTSDHNKLCILSDTSELSFKVVNKIEGGTEELSTLSVTLPKGIEYDCCAPFGDNIYIFGGRGENYSNNIYKFNCINETIEEHSTTLPQKLFGSCCSIFGSNIYIFGGANSTTYGWQKTIYNFSVSFELTANNVLLYCANSKYKFDLITDQVTIPINKVYIGDINNKAQLTEAYLYDETKSAWVNVNTSEVLTA